MPLLRYCHWLLLLATLSLSAPAPALGQTGSNTAPTMVSTIMPWWQMIQRSFVSAAEAMPEDKWSFAPEDGAFKGVRTFAEQVKHVACANYAFFNEIEKKTPPEACDKGGPSPARTKAELTKYLADSFAYAADIMKQMTPENALEAAGGPYGGTAAGCRWRSAWRCWHRRPS